MVLLPELPRSMRVLFGLTLRCRRCVNLAYASQSEATPDRALRQMRKIERRLAGEDKGNLPDRPKGMLGVT